MKVRVDSIQFDFESDDCYLEEPLASQVTESYTNRVFNVDIEDGDDVGDELCNMISNQSGWCIINLEYTIL